jgi:hypothetical protein
VIQNRLEEAKASAGSNKSLPTINLEPIRDHETFAQLNPIANVFNQARLEA